jgi:hypothetical protein
MRPIDVRVWTVIALLCAAGCGRAPISTKPLLGQQPVVQQDNSGTTNSTGGGVPNPACTPGASSAPYAGGDPCPQNDPQCPAPTYQAVATCGPDGTWVRDASGTIQCACVPTGGTATAGTGVGGDGGGGTFPTMSTGGTFVGADTGGGPAIGPRRDTRGAGVCDCSDSQGIITPASFECVCALAGCTPHARVAELPTFDCVHTIESGSWFDSSLSYVAHGCGLVAFMHSYSTGGTTRVYRESDHELVGAGIGQDTSFAICNTATYMTANTDLSLCPDYTICSPCGPGRYPACDGGETEYDGGI